MLPLLRFTRDLFEGLDPLAPIDSPHAAIQNVANVGAFEPGEHLQHAVAPAEFRHPQATREARLENAVVAYAFARGRRRTISFAIGPEGLAVRAPRWTPLAEVDRALQEKGRWIVRKLHEVHDRQQRQLSTAIVWADGARVPYLGGHVQVCLASHLAGLGKHANVAMVGSETGTPLLQVGLPQHASADQIREAVNTWLQQQAREIFTRRLDHFAPLLGVKWQRLRLSNATTRWGSACADGSIRLNWRLVHYSPAVVDYVVAHELSHLRVMDHSPQFWETVGSVIPDYKRVRGELKSDAVPQW